MITRRCGVVKCGGRGRRQYQLIYEEPVYPTNLYLDRAPYGHEDYRREVIDRQVELMHERGIWVRPGKDGPG